MHREAENYSLSTRNEDQQVECIHAYLTRSYWSEGTPIRVVEGAVRNSLCFGIFFRSEQVAFARVITDSSTFAYLCDVYVLEDHRGKELAHWLLEAVDSCPELQGLRRFMLATQNAHELYRRFGFAPPRWPGSLMERFKPEIYIEEKND